MRRLLLVCALVALGAPSVARADAVIDWNVQAQATILAPGPTAHASTLSFAMVHGAVYDAVNAIDHRYQPYLRVPHARRHASQDAAAATAAFRVLAALYPDQLATLQDRYDASLGAIADGRAKRRGIAAGEAAAAAMLAAREHDGRLPAGTPYPFPLGTAPGEWRVSPPLTAVDPAWWVGNVRPFLIGRATASAPPARTRLRARRTRATSTRSSASARSTARCAQQTRRRRRSSGRPSR